MGLTQNAGLRLMSTVENTKSDSLVALGEAWPELSRTIAQAPAVEWSFRDAQQQTLAVAGLQLASAHDPELEAELQAARVPSGSTEAFVYGMGQGFLPRALLKRPGMERVTVVLLNLAVARLVFEQTCQSDWLRDPRVSLVYWPDTRNVRLPFCVVPPSVQLAETACFALRDALMLRLQEQFVASVWSPRLDTICSYLKQNEALIAADPDVGQLFGKWLGRDFLVVGPAPTLAAGITKIGDLQSSSVIVAISTALQPLIEAGITPDLVIMIDSESIDPLTPEQRASFADVPLVYVAEIQNSTLVAWPGPRFVAYLDRPRYDDLRARYPRQNLWTEGTVTHSAIDLAVQCGAARVSLFGLDFGYPGGVSHATGTPDFMRVRKGDHGRTLLDGWGNVISSDLNLMTYLRDIEQYIELHPEVEFFRADRRGASLEGATWLED
jgi:hypothetical protein